jgi:hypothetical protein
MYAIMDDIARDVVRVAIVGPHGIAHRFIDCGRRLSVGTSKSGSSRLVAGKRSAFAEVCLSLSEVLRSNGQTDSTSDRIRGIVVS